MRTAADIRRMNSFAIVRALHATGRSTRRELADATDLSFATVAAICTELLERGIVAEGPTLRGGGRPTTTLSLNDGHGVLFGVDLAETYVHVETFDAALTPLSSTTVDIDVHSREPEAVAERVRGAIAAERARRSGERLLGVGVSVPGQVDRVGGTSVFAPNWNWHDVPLGEMLADDVDGPLSFDNPLKALAVAELWSEFDRTTQDFVVLNLGTGVGAGVAIDGRVLRGRTNSAGEWGHTVVVAGGRSCRCGSRGCVETYVGAPGILQTLRELYPDSPLNHADDQTMTIASIADGARAGDPVALDVVERVAHHLGIAMASIVNLLNPEAMIVGGWVSRALGDQLLPRALPHIEAHALAVPWAATSFDLQQSRGNAVSLGVAATALEGYLDSSSRTSDVLVTEPVATPSP